jgi:hypothetical protein
VTDVADPKSASRQVVSVENILRVARAQRESRFATDASRYAAQVLEGLAHDSVCRCEDSTVSHLRDWLADQREAAAEGRGSAVSESRSTARRVAIQQSASGEAATPVQREQQWLRERVGAPKEPRLGCSLVAHDRIGFCSACVPREVGDDAARARAENLGWQMLALRQDEVARAAKADEHGDQR